MNLEESERTFTRYPDQGGITGELVDYAMSCMRYPNRQLGTIISHAVISVLGGRVAYVHEMGGLVLTAKVYGRSTIGKGSIKKIIMKILNQLASGNLATTVSSRYLGAYYYTSIKNMVTEMLGQESNANKGIPEAPPKPSLLSIRTESGQTDMSSAGDMSRVRAFELELATESGPDGYIPAGAQNDKIPALYSPANTIIRESVYEIQVLADLQAKTAVSGNEGRASHVIIDPYKPARNIRTDNAIPSRVRENLLMLHKKAAAAPQRINEPYPRDKWIVIKFKNEAYLYAEEERWRNLENNAAAREDHQTSTFYGRLLERASSWAGRLALLENPDDPVITDSMLDVAVKSLEGEHFTYARKTADESNPWDKIVLRVLQVISAPEDHATLRDKNNFKIKYDKMFAANAIQLSRLMIVLRASPVAKEMMKDNHFQKNLLTHLQTVDIIEVDQAESAVAWNVKGKVLRKVNV